MTPVKVLLAIHHFPPTYSSGAEVYVYRLASWLLRQGFDVEVVCVESIEYDGDAQLECQHDIYESIPVWRLHLKTGSDAFQRSFENPVVGRWFGQLLRELRPDVVHVNSCYLLSASIISETKQQGLPLIVTLHDFWFLCPRITLLKPTGDLCTVPEDPAECAWCLATEKRRFRWPEIASQGVAGAIAKRWLVSLPMSSLLGVYPSVESIEYRRRVLMDALRQADVILSPSKFLRSMFIEQGVDAKKIVYSRLGLDTSHWIVPPEPHSESPEDLRLSYIGQLAPHKGVHLLIQAFDRLIQSQRRPALKIYGDAQAFPEYGRSLMMMANGNPRVEFAGRFENCRVAEILSDTDVVVVPSMWYENSPITIMEALTTGTPVVTADIGGMSELVQHDVNGLLFERGNITDLTNELQRLLDEPELVNALASNAHPVRMIDDEMEQVALLYEQMLRGPM